MFPQLFLFLFHRRQENSECSVNGNNQDVNIAAIIMQLLRFGATINLAS